MRRTTTPRAKNSRLALIVVPTCVTILYEFGLCRNIHFCYLFFNFVFLPVCLNPLIGISCFFFNSATSFFFTKHIKPIITKGIILGVTRNSRSFYFHDDHPSIGGVFSPSLVQSCRSDRRRVPSRILLYYAQKQIEYYIMCAHCSPPTNAIRRPFWCVFLQQYSNALCWYHIYNTLWGRNNSRFYHNIIFCMNGYWNNRNMTSLINI